MAQSRTPTPIERANPELVFAPPVGDAYVTLFDDIPFDNVLAMVKRTIKHKLSNECYTAVQNAVKEAAGLADGDTKEQTREKMKAYREANPDAYNETFRETTDKMWKLILTPGGITETDRPRLDPVDREYYLLLDKVVSDAFKGWKDDTDKAIVVPRNDTDTITLDGEPWTRADLRASFAAATHDGNGEPLYEDGRSRGEHLRERAQARVDELANVVKAPKAAPQKATSAAQFGLVKRPAA
jgi:hypothetical protein